eukprot:EG_transcript_30678
MIWTWRTSTSPRPTAQRTSGCPPQPEASCSLSPQQGLEQAQQRQELELLRQEQAQQRLHLMAQDEILHHHELTLARHAAEIDETFVSMCRVEPDDGLLRQRLGELAACRRLEGEALRRLVMEADLSRRVFAAVGPAAIAAGLSQPAIPA